VLTDRYEPLVHCLCHSAGRLRSRLRSGLTLYPGAVDLAHLEFPLLGLWRCTDLRSQAVAWFCPELLPTSCAVSSSTVRRTTAGGDAQTDN
jgi:hypothetical protein